MKNGTSQPLRWIVGVGLLAGVLGFVAQDASGVRPTAGEPARVCVINLEQVFDAAPQRVGMEAGLQARDTEIREEVTAKKGELDRLKGELELNRPGTEEYQRLQRDIVQKQADLQFVSKQFENEMERLVLDARGEILKEIRIVVARVCDTYGYDIVLQREFKIPKTAVVWDTAFYVRPEFDITTLVVSELSKE